MIALGRAANWVVSALWKALCRVSEMRQTPGAVFWSSVLPSNPKLCGIAT